MTPQPPDILKVRGLTIEYRSERGPQRALTHATFNLPAGESLCLVGPSGSAKTTLFRGILGILPRGTRVTGEVRLPGARAETISSMSDRDLREYRRTSVGAVFQDAPGSLVPGVPIGRQLERVYRLRQRLSRHDARRAAKEALVKVGFPDADEVWSKTSATLSGGMCQRCMTALALSAPHLRVLGADEPLSSLDSVSAAQVLDLLLQVQKASGANLLFITHDVRLACRFDWVAVLSNGRMVEMQRSADFVSEPASPEGQTLLQASRSLGRLPSAEFLSRRNGDVNA